MTSKMIQIAAAAIVCSAIGMSHARLLAQQAAAPSRSVWDGVYTKAQAARGSDLYKQACAKCHAPDLAGNGNMSTELAGQEFRLNWSGQTASDLFDRIHNSMPADNPGSLSEASDADLLAFIFSANGFPAGAKDLAHDSKGLAQIGIQSTKPTK
jgi:S-disulfanyl-L-cysteine oxidoreductase SoxD